MPRVREVLLQASALLVRDQERLRDARKPGSQGRSCKLREARRLAPVEHEGGAEQDDDDRERDDVVAVVADQLNRVRVAAEDDARTSWRIWTNGLNTITGRIHVGRIVTGYMIGVEKNRRIAMTSQRCETSRNRT